MEALFQGLAQAALLLLCIAMVVAVWEHLQQQADSRSLAPPPQAHDGALPAANASTTVDVHLDTVLQPKDASNSLAATSEALNRASGSARRAHDAAPWMDTQPRVAVGSNEPESFAVPLPLPVPKASDAPAAGATNHHAAPAA